MSQQERRLLQCDEWIKEAKDAMISAKRRALRRYKKARTGDLEHDMLLLVQYLERIEDCQGLWKGGRLEFLGPSGFDEDLVTEFCNDAWEVVAYFADTATDDRCTYAFRITT